MDRLVSVKSNQRFYGVAADLVLPTDFFVQGQDRYNYFDAYLGLDWFAEAGIFKYGNRSEWTLFLNAGRKLPQAASWWEEQVTVTGRLHFKLVFVSSKRVAFYVNGGLRKELPLAWPIPPNEYKLGGVQVKACHGAVDQDQTVFYNRMEIRNIQVRRDETGSRWGKLSNYRRVSTNSPPPELITQNPLVTSYMINRQRKSP